MTYEPTVIIWAIWTGLNAAQTVVISTPNWVHAVIIGLTAAIGALVNRSAVTPTGKI